MKVVSYIHNNPVRRGLAAAPQDWPWSSYRQWEGLDGGPLKVNRESLINAVN